MAPKWQYGLHNQLHLHQDDAQLGIDPTMHDLRKVLKWHSTATHSSTHMRPKWIVYATNVMLMCLNEFILNAFYKSPGTGIFHRLPLCLLLLKVHGEFESLLPRKSNWVALVGCINISVSCEWKSHPPKKFCNSYSIRVPCHTYDDPIHLNRSRSRISSGIVRREEDEVGGGPLLNNWIKNKQIIKFWPSSPIVSFKDLVTTK